MIRDILVHADGTKAGARRIAYALDLARLHHAVLNGLHVTPASEVPPTYNPSAVEGVGVALDRRLAEAAKSAERDFAAAVAKRRVRTHWTTLKGPVAPQICEAARTADVVVLGQYEWEGSPERHPLSLAEVVARDCGRPVIVVPAGSEDARIRRALIAWDGSREAARALHDALPLLGSATVEIVAANDSVSDAGIAELLQHLRHHHVAVENNIHLRGAAPATLLKDRLQQKHFDLLVMGAFGRPAWLEFLFGGTTQSALLDIKVPMLVSH